MAPRKTVEEQEIPTLRKVIPQLPAKEVDVEKLREDLGRMGCAGLLTVPWGFREEEMVRELIGEPPNQYYKTLRAHPKAWTKRTWQKVYGFRLGGSGLTSRKEDFAKDQFAGKIDAKEGYNVADCKDPRARAVLAFLIPIFYPEKPTRITVTWANTIFGSFEGKRAVDWGLLMSELITKLLKSLPRAKSTPLSSYLAHLYHQAELLSPDELRGWTAQDKIWKYGDSESETGAGDSDSDPPAPSPVQPSQAQHTPEKPIRAGVKRKTTPRTPEGEKRSARARLVEPAVTDEGDPDSPCARIIVAAREIQHRISIRDEMLETISDLVGCSTRSKLVEAVELALTNSNRIRELEATERRLTREKEALQEQLKIQEEHAREAAGRAAVSAKAIVSVREALALPADVVNKARLFEERLGREERLSRNKIIRFLVDQASSMERTLEEMRALADNMLPDEEPSTGNGKGKQPAHQPEACQVPAVIPDPEAGPSSRPETSKRKTIVVSDSEPEEVEESMAEGEASGRGDGEPDVEEGGAEAEGTQSGFKTPTAQPRYKTTPLRKGPSSADKTGGEGSGQKTPRTPGSGTATTPSPRNVDTPTSDQAPVSSEQRHKLRNRESGSGS